MKKTIIFTVLISLYSVAFSQPAVLSPKLDQLNPKQPFTTRYVNFDVIKFMLGHGQTFDHRSKYGFGTSFNLQGLWPYAWMKRRKIIPIAYGLNIGYAKISRKKAAYITDGKIFSGVKDSSTVNEVVQRTGYIGIVVLPVIRLKSFTILTGASFNYNIWNKLIYRSTTGRKSAKDKAFTNQFSTPLQFQVSYSKGQFISIGLYSTYDLQPRFKGPQMTDTNQFTIGLSLGLII